MKHQAKYISRAALLLVMVLFASQSALGQRAIVPNEVANGVFQSALAAFEAADYETAVTQFRDCFRRYPLHTYTTAAMLMHGKSLYRLGRYPSARQAMESFVKEYSTSLYVEEAVRIISYATEMMQYDKLFTLGILLPGSNEDISLSAALLNGVLLAVDMHNDSGTDANIKVRIVFRESSAEPESAYQSVRELKDAGAELIIGPLYSDEAGAAAQAAEELGVVLVAPLATDNEITENRQFAFQANPSIEMRGKLMAQFAINALRLQHFAVVAEQSSPIGDEMASGFEDELLRLGGTIEISDRLPGSNYWFKLNERYSSDAFDNVDAIYLPVTGGNAQALAKGALDSIDRLNIPIRVLGNKEWHNLTGAMQASQYDAVYTTDYDVEESRQVEDFRRLYESRFGSAPNSLSFIGFDVGNFVLLQLFAQDGPIHGAIANANYYQGLAIRIDFRGGNINQALSFFRYRNGKSERLR